MPDSEETRRFGSRSAAPKRLPRGTATGRRKVLTAITKPIIHEGLAFGKPLFPASEIKFALPHQFSFYGAKSISAAYYIFFERVRFLTVGARRGML